jgi:hypothetical protein
MAGTKTILWSGWRPETGASAQFTGQRPAGAGGLLAADFAYRRSMQPMRDGKTMVGPEIREDRDQLIVIASTPWRLHRGLLRFGGLAGVMLLLCGSLLVPILLMTDVLPAVAGKLRPLLGSVMFWVFVVVFGLLLALDRRSRRKLVWDAKGARISWLFGPLDLFPIERTQAELPPLEVIERPVPRILSWLFGGEGGDWVVGWQTVRRDDRPPQLRELARLPTRAEAEELRGRLVAWRDRDARVDTRPPAIALGASEIASLGLNRLMLWPLGLFVAMCLVPVSLMVDSIAVSQGLREQTLPWDSRAEATLERLSWRISESMSRTNLGGREIYRPNFASKLQAEVSFVDAEGSRQVRSLGLALPSGEYIGYTSGGPAGAIEAAAAGGVRLQPVVFELPSATLPIEVDADGALRFDTVATDPSAKLMSRAWLLHWELIVHLDRPSVLLPLLWSEPSLPRSFPVVYRAGASATTPVWPESLAQSFAPRLVDFDGDLHVLGILAFGFGGIAFAFLLPRRRRAVLALPLWVLICASSFYWDRLSDRAASWVGIDRGLSARLRDALAASKLPAAEPVESGGDGIVSGHWSPQRSRHRELLDLLGLLEPPPMLHPDFASARVAIAQRARERLALLSVAERDRLLDLDPQLMLPRGGDSWLLEAVITPGVCDWRDDAGVATQSRWDYASIGTAFDCAKHGN